MTVHATAGVPGPGRRRVLSVRFLGDDMVHAPRSWATSPPFPGLEHELVIGGPMDHPLFPVLWTKMTNDQPPRPWAETEPGQLIAKGHGAGDILEAWKWLVLVEQPGLLRVQVHLPDHLKNPQGQLFGGFTSTYVDMVSLYTVHTGSDDRDPTSPRSWLTTINMRCDYYEPIVDDTFIIQGEIVNQRGLTSLISTKFLQGETMAAHALTTIRELPNVQP